MNRFKAAQLVGLSGTLLSAPATARVGCRSTVAGLVGVIPVGMSSPSLTQEVI